MQKGTVQSTNIRSKVLLVTQVSRSRRSSDSVLSTRRYELQMLKLKFRNGWSDTSSDWLARRACFRSGILLPAGISCLRERHIETASRSATAALKHG